MESWCFTVSWILRPQKREYDMVTWKHALILSICLFWIVSASKAENTLIIATGEYPPFISESPEDSFLTDLFDEIGREMGVSFKFKFLPWKRCELEVEELKAWGAIPYMRSPEREQKFYFSDDWLIIGRVLFFTYSPDGRKQQIPYEELTDLKGYRFGGIIGYFYENMFRKAGLNVEYLTSEEQNFRKLQLGRIDLFPVGEATGWYRIKKLFPPEEVGKFFTLTKPLTKGSGDFLLTSKQYPNTRNLLVRFNLALKKLKENGTYQKILEQHGIVMTY
jgi:polar amino acid transport system substrate-binding protein